MPPAICPVWGEHVAQNLKNSRHIVVPGAGHITTMRGLGRSRENPSASNP